MQPVRVLVHGALGRMGQQVLSAVARRLRHSTPPTFNPFLTFDVMVDFTQHAATMPAVRLATSHHTSLPLEKNGGALYNR